MTDSITGLPTHREFPEQLARGGPLALLVDIDSLIWLNDQFGFEAGDRTLAQVAQVIRHRAADLAGALVFRVGSDEFLVVLPGVPLEVAFRVAETIVEDVRALEIPFRRSDDPTRTRVEVNAAVLDLTPHVLRSGFGASGITRSFGEWIARRIYERKQETSRVGVVADLRSADWGG